MKKAASPPSAYSSTSAPSRNLDPRALSRLYLHAILPTLAELVYSLPEAVSLAQGMTGIIQMRIARGPAVALIFESGRITPQLVHHDQPDIDLVYLNDAHLNGYCRGDKWKIPLVVRGLLKTAMLSRFSRLCDLLEMHLNPTPEALKEVALRRLFARLTFTVMARGLPPLAHYDADVRAALDSLPRGLAQFTFRAENLSLWMEIQDGIQASSGARAESGLGQPPRSPEVLLDFGRLETAVAAMRNDLDSMAAVAGGQMSLSGLAPLADGLDRVLNRLRDYLEP